MPILESIQIVNASDYELFWLSQDYYLRAEWDPFTKENYFLDGAKVAAKGVRVFVRAYNGLTMTAVLVNFQPPLRATMQMEKGPFIFKKFAGTWAFKSMQRNITEVTFRYNIQVRNKFLENTIGFFVYWILRRDIKKRLLALKKSAETTDILTRLTNPIKHEK